MLNFKEINLDHLAAAQAAQKWQRKDGGAPGTLAAAQAAQKMQAIQKSH